MFNGSRYVLHGIRLGLGPLHIAHAGSIIEWFKSPTIIIMH